MNKTECSAEQPEKTGQSPHGDEALSSQELGGIVGGRDYGGWSEGNLRKEITRLEMLVATYERGHYEQSARNQSKELYAAQTALIKLVGEGDYSPGALLWQQ